MGPGTALLWGTFVGAIVTGIVIPTNARAEWRSRSIRRPGDTDDPSNNYTVSVEFATGQAELGDSSRTPVVTVILCLRLSDARFIAGYEIAVQFVFQDRDEVSDEEAGEFVVAYGFDYALALIRGALFDSSLILGESVLLPVATHQQVREWVLNGDRDK